MSTTLRASESSIESVCGLYVIEVESKSSPSDYTYVLNKKHWATDVRINNTYIGVEGRMEMECRDFEIVDGVLHITM